MTENQISRLSCEISYGRTDGWGIDLSTQPGRIGKALLPAELTLEGLKGHKAAGKKLSAGVFPPPGGWTLQ